MTGNGERRTSALRFQVLAALAALLLLGLTACGGTGASSASVCDLREPATQAVLSGQGPYAGQEKKLAAAFRSAGIPEGNADDVSELKGLRSEAATAIDTYSKVPKGDEDALDDARGSVESVLAGIAGNELCPATGSGATVRPIVTTVPCPAKTVTVGTPTPWEKVKDAYSADEWAATVTITNPNDRALTVYASKAEIAYTGGRIPSALTGPFAATPPESGVGLFTALVGPGETGKVTLQASSGQAVTAITTVNIYMTGLFVFGGQNCPAVIDGAKPLNAAPLIQDRSEPQPGRLPECRPGASTVGCT